MTHHRFLRYWVNAIKTATPTAQRRFIDTFQLYTDSVVQQAADRDDHRIRDIDSYFAVRRDTIGAKPSFAINEVHLNLTDEVLNNPIVMSLTASCIDMLIIGNDLCSYNIEYVGFVFINDNCSLIRRDYRQARGDDGHNLVTIVMNEKQLDLHAALEWIGELHDRLVAQFLSDFPKVPSFGSEALDAEVAIYVDGLGNWVRANDTWSFEASQFIC